MKVFRGMSLCAAALFASGCIAASEPALSSVEAQTARGQMLVETHCGSCHATGLSGESPYPEAPAFRLLSQNYRVAMLAEALAEGISVGHPAMPEFTFAVEDVDAIIAYLEAVQIDGSEAAGGG